MRTGRGLALLAGAAFLFGAAPAGATTLQLERVEEEGDHYFELHIKTEEAAQNQMSVRVDGAGDAFVIRDPGERLRPDDEVDCERTRPHAVRCPAVEVVRVKVGRLADSVRVTGSTSDQGLPEVEIRGGRGADHLVAAFGGIVAGDAGDDTLIARSDPIHRSAYLQGGPGDDVARASRGTDIVAGGAGDDILRAGRGNDQVTGGTYAEEPTGPAGHDRMFGGPGHDDLNDRDRGDPLQVNRDRLVGGAGDDEVSYYGETAVRVDLMRRNGHGEEGENDFIQGVENVRSGRGDDVLLGNREANMLDGGLGDDSLVGRGGNDTVLPSGTDRAFTGAGDDEVIALNGTVELRCGLGNDTVINGAPQANDPPYEPAAPFVPADCDQISTEATIWDVPRSFAMASTPTLTDDDELVFEVFMLQCCGNEVKVTEPSPPFTELGRATVEDDQVAVPVPAEVADAIRAGQTTELRAVMFGNPSYVPPAWRFTPEP
ncbi:MAG TPA: calcium-binding protein [Thermoleophilaceae bacterium]|nr:calcium-binding protein [Thermoleophilaceae bacterium]